MAAAVLDGTAPTLEPRGDGIEVHHGVIQCHFIGLVPQISIKVPQRPTIAAYEVDYVDIPDLLGKVEYAVDAVKYPATRLTTPRISATNSRAAT
nr:hypothetical protein [Micromonospora sp. DSM 115978]